MHLGMPHLALFLMAYLTLIALQINQANYLVFLYFLSTPIKTASFDFKNAYLIKTQVQIRVVVRVQCSLALFLITPST